MAPSRQKHNGCSSAYFISYIPKFLCFKVGEVTMKKTQSGERKREKGSEKREMEWSIKRNLLNRHQASPGGGEELYPRPSHLLSRRTEREREGAREMKARGGWERWRGSSNSAHRSNEHSLSLAVSQKWSWEDDENIYTRCTTRLDSRSPHSQVFSH